MPPNTSTFRSVERHSYARTNIFALESTVVLAAYIWALRIRLSNAAPKRCALLEGFGAVYFARLNFMTIYLLQRELALEELTVVMLLWLPSILGSFVYLSSEDSDLTCTESIILVAMYLLGSFLNTYSEYQRKIWKRDPRNKGRCYTMGLFAWSRNVNYFGDVVLFASWAGATGRWLSFVAPTLMALSFWYHHIPDKERYLAKRYGRDWIAYMEQTPYALVPYVC